MNRLDVSRRNQEPEITVETKPFSNLGELRRTHERRNVRVPQEPFESTFAPRDYCGVERKYKTRPRKSGNVLNAGCQRVPMRVRVDNLGRKIHQAAIRIPTEHRAFSQIASTWNVPSPFAGENRDLVGVSLKEPRKSVDERRYSARDRVGVRRQ